MCISLPAKICSLDGQKAEVEIYNARRSVFLSVAASQGDWVLIHGGIAVATISPQEAQETLELIGKLTTPQEGSKS